MIVIWWGKMTWLPIIIWLEGTSGKRT
uniref:Uncharacterized protein n=1 Tax=Arundo donax TaxID=35708 RepID=A0A0A8YVD5_ARUDO